MSRKGFPKHENALEIASDNFVTVETGTTIVRNWESSYASLDCDSIGDNSPNWPHEKIENSYQGWNGTAKATAANVSGEITSGGVVTHTIDGQYPITALCPSFNPFHHMDSDDLLISKERCLALLIKRIKNQKVNVAIAAAEFKKTCSTVSSAARRIASAIGALKKGNVGGAVRTLGGGSSGGGKYRDRSHGGRRPRPPVPPSTGSVAKDWLAIQYGWRPLISDVYGAAEELARTLAGRPPAVRVTARAGKASQFERIFPPIQAWCPPCKGVRNIQVTTRGFIEYGVGSQLANIASNTGITNPLAVAWEVIPYSFVVDWFIPVGTYLNSLDYAFGLVFKRGSLSSKGEGNWTIGTKPGRYAGGGISQTWSGGSFVAKSNYFERVIMGDFPSVPAPRFTDPTSLRRVANALALLRVAFGR